MEKRRSTLIGMGLALFLVSVGHWAILHRGPHGPSYWLQLSPDALQYIDIAEGDSVRLPFAPRKGVPFLASLLPFQTHTNLQIITYLSLALIYFLQWLILQHQQFSISTICLAIFFLFSSPSHLIYYSNPHLADPFAYLSLTAMFYFLLKGKAALFGLAAVCGVLARENCFFGIPIFAVTKRWTSLGVIFFAGLIAFVLPRLDVGLGYYLIIYRPFHPEFFWGSYWIKVFLTYGFLWIPMILGLFLCRGRYFPAVAVTSLLLLGGTFYSIMVSDEAVRIFGMLIPIAPTLFAYFLESLQRKSKTFLLGFGVLAFLNVLWAVPTLFFPEAARGLIDLEQWYERLKMPIILYQTLGLGFSVYATFLVFRRPRA